MSEVSPDPVIEDIEFAMLLEAVSRRYGHELRDWEYGRVRTRVHEIVEEGRFTSISALQEQILRDDAWLDRLMRGLWSRPGRGMFADPSFWRTIRWKIVPFLRTWPTVKAWVAGCATGDDAWTLAALFEEEGLAGRTLIHATDLDDVTLRTARAGAVTHDQIAAWEGNYRLSGGIKRLSTFFSDEAGSAVLRRPLTDRIVYSRHVPGIEPSFNEFHLILFRNPWVWTERRACDRVGALLRDSQVTFGFLCLDNVDTMQFLPRGIWNVLDRDLAIARRIA